MAGFLPKLGRARVRLRLVVGLPLLILLVSTAVISISYVKISRVLQQMAFDHHLALARNLTATAQREAEERGGDLFGALGSEVGMHARRQPEEGVRFVLVRTEPAGPILFFDPEGFIGTRDQTQLLTLTTDLATPRVMPIGFDALPHLVTAHMAVRNGYFLIAMEPFRNVRALAGWALRLGAIVAVITALALLATAWVMTAPLHRLAERIRELARRELLDPKEIEEIIEKAREPEEVAALTLALEQALTAMVNLKRSIHGIIETMEGGILAADEEGRLQLINSAAREIMGLEGSLVGRPLRQIVPSPEGNTAFIAILDELLNEQITYSRPREIQIVNGRGETLELGVATSLIPGEEGKILSSVVVILDLTELVELQERVRKADRLSALGSMATKVAHEIRNPLGSVKGLGQLVLESEQEGSETYRYMERIVREVDRLSNIVDELLDYSQRRPLTLDSVDLNDVVREGLDMARFREGDHAPTLLQELDLSLSPIRMDRNRFLQAVLNVLVNALQAIDSDGGVVTVSTFREETTKGGQIVLEISDNGPGIPPDVLDHIFDPFFTTKEDGSGLGLSIAHTIVREHEGVLEVDSKLGQGTTFRILLPRYRWGEV
ncbi:MAG: PAS domain S-box protein [Candidatus Latescibacteria bacterium]|nr:PAS domain S-box protein [Candidatus Latescibacterota bacterium]